MKLFLEAAGAFYFGMGGIFLFGLLGTMSPSITWKDMLWFGLGWPVVLIGFLRA